MLMTQMEIHSERAARRQSHSIRLFTLTGIIGSILFVLVFTIDSFLRPGYSPIFQVVSDLGVGQDEVRIFGAGVTVAAGPSWDARGSGDGITGRPFRSPQHEDALRSAPCGR